MKLTGEAKGMFTDFFYSKMMLEGHSDFRFLAQFSKLPESMQWGVYQDWADSVGYHIETYIWYCMDDKNNYYGAEVRYQDISDFNKTRQEARNAAIEKLNEIINEK